MVVGDIRNRVAVDLLGGFQLPQHPLRSGKFVFVSLYELLQFLNITPVKLHQTPAQQTGYDKLEISRAHGQKGQQGKTGPKIYGCQPAGGRILGMAAFQAVRLTLPGGPLVLPGEFVRPHLMEQFDEPVHEFVLRPVLR